MKSIKAPVKPGLRAVEALMDIFYDKTDRDFAANVKLTFGWKAPPTLKDATKELDNFWAALVRLAMGKNTRPVDTFMRGLIYFERTTHIDRCSAWLELYPAFADKVKLNDVSKQLWSAGEIEILTCNRVGANLDILMAIALADGKGAINLIGQGQVSGKLARKKVSA